MQPVLPPQLVWSLVRKQNRFLVKRDRAQFSAEPGNLTNTSNYRSSGIANAKAVDVTTATAGEGEKVVLTYKAKKSCKPASATVRIPLRNDPRRSARLVRQATSGTYYRADLKQDALARYSRQQKALNRKKAGVVAQGKRGRRR